MYTNTNIHIKFDILKSDKVFFTNLIPNPVIEFTTHFAKVLIPSSAGHQSRLCWPPESTLLATRANSAGPPESAKERRSCKEDPHPKTEAVTDFPKYKDEMLNGHDT